MQVVLQLQLTLGPGQEAACARDLWAKTRTEGRPILAALAAELVALHEAASQGATRVLVVGEAEATAVLERLAKAPLVG